MKKYILLSIIALGSISCTDSFLEEKMVSTITQDYFETEQGLEQLIVGTYDALRVTKQYEQGPASLMAGVDNFSQKTASRGIPRVNGMQLESWQVLPMACAVRMPNHY